MQRALSYALSPGLNVPLRFLLTAPCFAVLAGLLLLAYGGAAFDSRWAAPALAATHLLTLGFLSMAMAGSMLQLIPVVAGQELAAPQLAGTLAWALLAAGTLALAAAFLGGPAWLFVLASVLLAIAVSALVAAACRALVRRAPAGSKPMVAGMRLALPALSVTVALGIALALTFAGALNVPLLQVTELHVGWGLVGWVALLVASVAFQVIPMFQGAPSYPAAMTTLAGPALAGLLLAWTAASWIEPAAAIVPGILAALLLGGFGGLSLKHVTRAKKKQADGTTLYWRLSLGSLVACTALYSLPAGDNRAQFALGMLFICGFAMGAVNGMLYKIVPFLLWYHLQQDPLAKKGDVPPIRLILPEEQGRRQFWLHLLALAALLAALYWPQWLARPAGALLALASLRLAVDLARATLACRSLQRRINHPS